MEMFQQANSNSLEMNEKTENFNKEKEVQKTEVMEMKNKVTKIRTSG